MKKYLLLFCRYDPDNYSGHWIEEILAENLEDAKEAAKKTLEEVYFKSVLEFRLVEIGEHDSHCRLWDTRKEPNVSGNEYTSKNYWETSS